MGKPILVIWWWTLFWALPAWSFNVWIPSSARLSLVQSNRAFIGSVPTIQHNCFQPCLEKRTLRMVMEDFSIFDRVDDDDDDGKNSVDEEEYTDDELLAMAGDWDDKIARFNTVHLTGRLGQTPEARYFDDGKVVVNVSLASRRKYHSMERVAENIRTIDDEETEWYALEIWGQTAEFVANFVDKGARVGVIGSLQVDEWNDRETGEKRQRAKIVVRDFDMLETRAEAEARRQGRGRGGPSGGGGGTGSGYGNSDDGFSPAGSGDFFS